jgi:replication factor A2
MWNDNEFNSTFSSPGGGGDKEGKDLKKNLIKHIVPVTGEVINQCKQVEGETSLFEYKFLNFHQICLVGIIRSVIKRANDITYLINDMTSVDVNVKLQSDETDDMETEEARPKQSQFMENQYVRVYGVVKQLQGQKIVQAFRIIPIKDLNEVTHHILECMNASIHYKSKACGGGSGGAENNTFEMSNTSNTVKNPLKNSNLSSKDTLNDQINNLIKSSKSSGEGLHIKEICSYFKHVPESKIKEILEFLSNEGHIYSTIDDEHYQTTEST